MTNSRLGRRRFLSAAVATAAAIPFPVSAAPRGSATTLRWLGTSGWRIDIGAKTVLIDPYLSRFSTGLFAGAFNPATALTYSMAFPGVRPAVPPRPATIADLPEGDTLAFQVTPRGGPSMFFMGASDFVERNLAGLAPDVAMIAVPGSDATHDYVPRLLAALDRPATVVPVHWDNFETPLTNPPTVTTNDRARLDTFLAAVRGFAPRTRILVPQYLTPYDPATM